MKAFKATQTAYIVNKAVQNGVSESGIPQFEILGVRKVELIKGGSKRVVAPGPAGQPEQFYVEQHGQQMVFHTNPLEA